MYEEEIKKIKKDIKNKKELRKIEERFEKHKDEYLFLIKLLDYKAKEK